MKWVKFFAFVGLLVVFVQSAFATNMLINSGDWRTTYLGIMYGARKGYNTLIISSLGDADLFAKALPKNESVVVFENSKNGIVHNAARLLSLNGLTNITDMVVNDPLDYQIEIAKKLNDNCIIVIPSAFTIDAESAAPYALINNCTVLMWDYAHSKKIINFLKSAQEQGKQIMFFGDIEERPWVIFPNSTVISGGPYEINKEMVKRVLGYYREKGEKLWVVVVRGDSLEQGYLVEKLPILVYSGDVKDTIKFLLDNGVYHIEAIGPNMMDIASRIRDDSHKKIGVVVKFGRTFTGIPGLTGKVFPLNVIEGDLPYPHMDVYGVFLDKHNKLLLVVFKNDGNTKLQFSIPALYLRANGSQLASLADMDVYKFFPGQYFPVSFSLSSNNSQLGSGNAGINAYLYAIYNQNLPLSYHVGSGTPPVEFSINLTDLSDNASIALVDARYFTRSGKIVVRIKNTGNHDVYVYGQLMNFTYGNSSVVMAPVNYTRISPGGTGQLEFLMFLSKKELDANRNVSLLLFYGSKYPLLVKKMQANIQLGTYTPGILDAVTGMLVAVLASPVFYVLVALVVVVFVFYRRRHHRGKRTRMARKR